MTLAVYLQTTRKSQWSNNDWACLLLHLINWLLVHHSLVLMIMDVCSFCVHNTDCSVQPIMGHPVLRLCSILKKIVSTVRSPNKIVSKVFQCSGEHWVLLQRSFWMSYYSFSDYVVWCIWGNIWDHRMWKRLENSIFLFEVVSLESYNKFGPNKPWNTIIMSITFLKKTI